MNVVRIIEYQDLFSGSPAAATTYLNGNSRSLLLRTATFFLGRFASGVSGYWDDFDKLFGSYNRSFYEPLYRKLESLAKAEGSDLRITHPRVSLALFATAFKLPDLAATKNDAHFEQDVLRAYATLNSHFVQQQDQALALAKAKPEMQQVPELAMFSLVSAHADFDIINQENVGLLMLTQITKAIKLFQFLETTNGLRPLLTKFLEYYDCPTWQEYLHRLLPAIMPVISADKGGNIQVSVDRDDAYEKSCSFLDKLALQPGEALVEPDFLSMRAKAMYKTGPGEYEIIYPAFLIETIYKGLYFKLSELNNATTPRLLGPLDFRGTYCNLFSEQYLLNTLLDDLFQKSGFHFSGSQILAGQYLHETGDSEPDYYYRSGRNVLLVESKDVLLRKEAKSGDRFDSYLEEVKKKFYFDHDKKGRVEKKAVLQLIGNVQRVLTTGMPFDPSCQPNDAIVHPVLLVHDRQFNLPGLNVLVDTWFQQELHQLAATGLDIRRVRPLVILDVDTLLALAEPLRKRRIILFDALQAYHRYRYPLNKRVFVRNKKELNQIIMREFHPFSLFLSNHARQKGFSPIPRHLVAEIMRALDVRA